MEVRVLGHLNHSGKPLVSSESPVASLLSPAATFSEGTPESSPPLGGSRLG